MRIAVLDDRASVAGDLENLIRLVNPNDFVVSYTSVDEAIDACQTKQSFDVWVVDLMMPTGRHLDARDTDSGLKTGTQFIRKVLMASNPPIKKILVFTSRDVSEDELNGDNNAIELLYKGATKRIDVADLIREFGDTLL